MTKNVSKLYQKFVKCINRNKNMEKNPGQVNAQMKSTQLKIYEINSYLKYLTFDDL